MTVEAKIGKITARLRRSTSRRYPVSPTVLVSGPRLTLSTGDADQPFFVASIDKVFIATLIAQLFDEATCSPETAIGRLLPDDVLSALPAAEGVDIAREVTVEHLLSHTSGLPDVLLPPRGYQTTCSIKQLVKKPDRVWTISEMLRQCEHLPAVGRPGERFLYSDTAYFLLIRIIEEASGMGFGERLRERVFEPSGMSRSAEWVDADAEKLATLVPHLAPFWLGKPGRDDREAFAPNLTWSNGLGGPSTAGELVQFQRELHAGRLCDLRWIQLMSEPRNRFRPGIHYGAGFVALRFAGFSPFLRGYPAAIGGLGYTAAHMFYYPQQDTHVVLNYHGHRRMQRSFQTQIRLAGLIKQEG